MKSVDKNWDDELRQGIRSVTEYSLPGRRIYLVTQFNHPREISPKASAAGPQLRVSGLEILS